MNDRRPPMFATKVIRILTRSAAAQELGPNVCWLIAVIVGQEDSPSVRYSRPVTYYYEQLMPLCGFKSRKQLRAAITTAVEAGWLEYTPGGKACPGRFRVKLPDAIAGIEAHGCDESDTLDQHASEKCSSESELETETKGKPKTTCSSESELQRGTQDEMQFRIGTAKGTHAELQREPMRNCKGNTFLPVPIPIPKEEEGAASGESSSGSSKNGKGSYDPEAVDLPPPLRTERFAATWRDWCQHRREIRKPLTPTSTRRQLAALAQWGERRAIAAIEHTVANGWQGIREPDGNGRRPPPTEERPAADAKSIIDALDADFQRRQAAERGAAS